MTDQEVKTEATEEAKEPKVKKVREPKPKAPPKPTRFAKGWTQENWDKHLATMTATAVPEGWISMAVVCKAAISEGIKTSRIVAACGGDRAGDDIWDPVFEVKYVGSRKFLSPESMTKGFALLKDPLYHPAHKGRIAKPKDPNAEPKTRKKRIQPAPEGEPEPWVEPANSN